MVKVEVVKMIVEVVTPVEAAPAVVQSRRGRPIVVAQAAQVEAPAPALVVQLRRGRSSRQTD